MTWSNITKPINSSWTNTNPSGRTQYDQVDITYDDAGIFYDGVNEGAWTKLTKPTTSSWTNIAKPV